MITCSIAHVASNRHCSVQVDINRQGEAMYDATFGAFLQAIRTKNPSLLRSSFADALKTYQTTRWIADASRQTSQSAWNAPVPWVTRAQPSWTNAAADIIKEAQDEQAEQVRQPSGLIKQPESALTPSLCGGQDQCWNDQKAASSLKC